MYFCVDVTVLEQVCNPRETSPRQRFILSNSLSATNEANSFMHRYLRSLPLLSVASLAVCSVRNASTGSSSGYNQLLPIRYWLAEAGTSDLGIGIGPQFLELCVCCGGFGLVFLLRS
jgi:hypothetical protein